MIQLLYYLQTAICFALLYWVVASRISLHSERQENATAMEDLRQHFQKQLSKTRQAAFTEVRALQDQLRSTKKQLKNLQEKNADMTGILNKTNKENQELRLHASGRDTAMALQDQCVQQLKEELAAHKKAADELTFQVNQLETDLETSHKLSHNHLEEWDRDKKRLESVQERLKETQQRLKFMTGKADQASHIISSLKSSNDSAIAQIMAHKEKIEKLERQLQDAKDETKELEERHKRIWDYTLQHMREMNLPEVRINHFIQGAESAMNEITLDSFFDSGIIERNTPPVPAQASLTPGT